MTKIYIVGLKSHHLIGSLISVVSELNWLTQVDDEILGVTELIRSIQNVTLLLSSSDLIVAAFFCFFFYLTKGLSRRDKFYANNTVIHTKIVHKPIYRGESKTSHLLAKVGPSAQKKRALRL